jgi:putative ABC transport system permease protein
MSLYLASKEIWRNRNRYFLLSLVIALITTLVLFIAGLAQGLSRSNKEYLANLDAQLIVFQKNTELSASSSQIGRSTLNNLQRVEGVDQVGGIGLSAATYLPGSNKKQINISLIGVTPNNPGLPDILKGSTITTNRGTGVVIDQGLANQTGLTPGDEFRIKTIQGTQEKFFTLTVIGIAPSSEYLFRSSVFVPYETWDQIRPQPANKPVHSELVSNIIAIKLKPDADLNTVAESIRQEVPNVDVADLPTAIEAIPGYRVQQSTLNLVQGFSLIIGVLVIGGFFQIQMLQKIPLIGVLKAIGTSNSVVAKSVVYQIILVSTVGVLMGGFITGGLALGLPSNVPIAFSGSTVLFAIIALLLIGPLGGLITVRLAVSVEPLTALGLTQ